MRKSFIEYIAEAEARSPFVVENASFGATCAANVAAVPTAIGGLGVGFDPEGSYGIYPRPKRAKKTGDKVTVIRRNP